MRTMFLGVLLAAGLSLGAGLVAAQDASLDQVTLRDGRVLSGTVLEETKDKLSLQVNGVTRLYDRSLVQSVRYGSGPAEASPAVRDSGEDRVPDKVTSKAASLDQDLADRYQVPLDEVLWVRRQGVTDADLPMVFFVASQAAIRPGGVVRLRLQGLSWTEIEEHYGLEPRRIYYVESPWVPYPYYYPQAYWGRSRGWGWGGGWRGAWHRGWRH